MNLKRTIEQWKELDPPTMALQSKSTIAYALDDARHDILAMHEALQHIREAFYAYWSSEGCSCCGNTTAHRDAEDLLGRLLGVARYPDNSGVDWKTVLPSAQRQEGGV